MKGHENSGNPGWARRPKFRQGQKLRAEELNVVTELHATRLRHALLGLAGPGVVYGYNIETDADCRCKTRNGCLQVECGYAYDYCGHILHYLGGLVCMNNLAGCKPTKPGRYTLWVHYAEKHEEFDDNCDKDVGSPWVQEGVVFSLTPDCDEICDRCPPKADECITENDYICGRLGADDDSPVPPQKDLAMLCKCCGELCPVDCDDWLYDPRGIPLACVEVVEVDRGGKDCDSELEFADTEPHICRHRPYVYRNPLLYELLHNCHRDLPRVADLSFRPFLKSTWDTPVPWERFARAAERGFEISFTRPIQTSTLHRSSIFFTALVGEHESHFLDELRFPVESMTFPGETGGYTKRVFIQFPDIWIRRQLKDPLSRFETGALIECTIRGAMVKGECDCLLNALPLADEEERDDEERRYDPKHSRRESGCDEEPCELREPAMPGDDFVVAFCVAPKPQVQDKEANVPMPGMRKDQTI